MAKKKDKLASLTPTQLKNIIKKLEKEAIEQRKNPKPSHPNTKWTV